MRGRRAPVGGQPAMYPRRTPGTRPRLRFALWASCSAAFLAVAALVLRAGDVLAQERARANAEPQQFDPAAKKLLSANGKFERGLYKLAASEYEEFLAKYADHPDATGA